ncbi:hypothetical protein FOZ62_003384 [Perkinsus olseni]|nr:hypothetical protein FOZ62_003384 [Perkinsus olseni]
MKPNGLSCPRHISIGLIPRFIQYGIPRPSFAEDLSPSRQLVFNSPISRSTSPSSINLVHRTSSSIYSELESRVEPKYHQMVDFLGDALGPERDQQNRIGDIALLRHLAYMACANQSLKEVGHAVEVPSSSTCRLQRPAYSSMDTNTK